MFDLPQRQEVPHAYNNKYELAEALGGVALAGLVTVLEVLGLNGKTLLVLKEWSEERAVTLRFKAEERCELDRETKREQESDTKYVREYSGAFGGGGKTTDKVVTTITEWFWRYEVEYEVYAFAGASEQEGKVVLQGRKGKYEIMTTSKEAPRPKVTIRDAMDVNISPLQRQLDAKGTEVHFAINREAKECRTPRRNPEVEDLVRFFEEVEDWGERVHRYFVSEIFLIQGGHGLDVDSANDKTVFGPVMPLFVRQEEMEREEDKHYTGQSLVKVGRVAGIPNMGTWNLGRFLDEQKRSLGEKLSELAKVFPDGVKLVTVAEANILVATEHLQTLSHYLAAGVDYIEELLRKQLVAAIGKEVTAVDFTKYMAYHNSRIFRKEYQSKPFCYAIRRPDHSPEGVVALEVTLEDGSISQPVETIVATSKLETAMQFSIAASAKVSFTGQVFVHGLMMHQFGDETGMKLSLSARARQFGSFLVLVGRIAGPGLFDPQFGMICKNKDEITIPLDIETIPSAGEFKAATVSISPEQQAFAKMFRGMQLASTLFAVCVIQIKPQLEKLLNLTEDSLTREIKLTQDVMELFIVYQIPSDLLSYGGGSTDKEVRLGSVRRNVRSVQLLLESEELKEEIDTLSAAEKRKLAAFAAVAAAAEKRRLEEQLAAAAAERVRAEDGAQRSAYVDPTGTVTEGIGGRFTHKVHVAFNDVTGFRGLPPEWSALLQSSAIVRHDVDQEVVSSFMSFSRSESKPAPEKPRMKIVAPPATSLEAAAPLVKAVSPPDTGGFESNIRQKVPADTDAKTISPRQQRAVVTTDQGPAASSGKLSWNRRSGRSSNGDGDDGVVASMGGKVVWKRPPSTEGRSGAVTSTTPPQPPRPPRERSSFEVLQELQKRRAEIAAELKAIEEAKRQSDDAIVSPSTEERIVASAEASVDYTKIPSDLDAALEKMDLEGALRPAIINVGKTWSKRSQAGPGLMGNATNKLLAVAEQKLEKQACFDLLDGLTKSGSEAFAIEGAALHIVVSTTHCFEKNVMDTLVRDSVNPIAKVEHSALIVASRIFEKPAEELVVENARERIAGLSPMLFSK